MDSFRESLHGKDYIFSLLGSLGMQTYPEFVHKKGKYQDLQGLRYNTCKQMVSQAAVDPQLPSFPFFTSLGRRSLKYISHILRLILIESAL